MRIHVCDPWVRLVIFHAIGLSINQCHKSIFDSLISTISVSFDSENPLGSDRLFDWRFHRCFPCLLFYKYLLFGLIASLHILDWADAIASWYVDVVSSAVYPCSYSTRCLFNAQALGSSQHDVASKLDIPTGTKDWSSSVYSSGASAAFFLPCSDDCTPT